jgi:hypothetical protein
MVTPGMFSRIGYIHNRVYDKFDASAMSEFDPIPLGSEDEIYRGSFSGRRHMETKPGKMRTATDKTWLRLCEMQPALSSKPTNAKAPHHLHLKLARLMNGSGRRCWPFQFICYRLCPRSFPSIDVHPIGGSRYTVR